METYKLIRSRRKTISLHVTADAQLEVRAPLRVPKSIIDGFIEEKQEWIQKNISVMRQRLEDRQAFALSEVSSLPLLGQSYPVRLVQRSGAQFSGEAFLLPHGDEYQIKEAAVSLYRQLAREYIVSRVRTYEPLLGVTPSGVKINSASTRWGSCSAKNSLNFSWKLIMAPQAAVDYVVVHELCHCIEHNHSKKFWALVERVLPDYKARRQMLKDLQETLSQQDWD